MTHSQPLKNKTTTHDSFRTYHKIEEVLPTTLVKYSLVYIFTKEGINDALIYRQNEVINDDGYYCWKLTV